MPRPDDLPTYATDTNYTNGPDTGTATKVEPSAGELAEGNIRGTAPTAQKFNWWQNLVGSWVGWLDEISAAVVANLAALAAIEDPTDGMVRNVVGQGIYVFKTSATTGLYPFRVPADDLTAGGWVAGTAHQEAALVRMVSMLDCAGIFGATTAATIAGASFEADIIEFGGGDAKKGNAYVQLITVNTGASLASAAVFPLNNYLIDGCTLGQVRVRVIGATGHSALPTLMPAFCVMRTDGVANQSSLISGGGTVVDTAADVTAYQTSHWITGSCNQNNVIDKSLYSYYLAVQGEGNTNALADLRVRDFVELTMTPPNNARRS